MFALKPRSSAATRKKKEQCLAALFKMGLYMFGVRVLYLGMSGKLRSLLRRDESTFAALSR